MKIYRLPLGPIQANCYIVIDETSGKAAIIDVGDFNESLKEIIDGDEIKSVEYIILTHGHYDHIFGVYEARKYTGAMVAIHEADADCLWDENKSLSNQTLDVSQTPLKPDMLLKDKMTLNIGNISLKVMHTPGHTKGGICLICEDEKIIFSGDTLFCKTCGRTDLPGGDWETLKGSLICLSSLEGDYTVYPGHNQKTKLDYERTHNRYMRKF